MDVTTKCPACGTNMTVDADPGLQGAICTSCGMAYGVRVRALRAEADIYRLQPVTAPPPQPQPPETPPPAPEARRILWGVSMSGVPYSLVPLEAWVRDVSGGFKPRIIHTGLKWSDGTSTGYKGWPVREINNAAAYGATPMISWTPEGGDDDTRWQLARIIRGEHDAYIRRFAADAKAWGKPFFLRIMHEMNGGWGYPWQEDANSNRRGEFVPAWRRIVDLLREVGAHNAQLVWCPNIDYPGSKWQPFEHYYPGDAYVDWTGLDGYNWAAVRGEPWRSAVEIFRWSYDQIRQFAPGKPFMIGEFGSVEQGAPAGESKARWLTEALRDLPAAFPQLRALVLYDRVDGKADWRIESSAASVAAFKAAIADPIYAAG